MLASSEGHGGIVTLLIEANAQVDKQDEVWCSVYLALLYNTSSLCIYLLYILYVMVLPSSLWIYTAFIIGCTVISPEIYYFDACYN